MSDRENKTHHLRDNLFFLWEMLRCRGERARACMTGPILTAPRVSLTAWPYRPRGDGLLLLLVSSCVCKYEYISGVVVTHITDDYRLRAAYVTHGPESSTSLSHSIYDVMTPL